MDTRKLSDIIWNIHENAASYQSRFIDDSLYNELRESLKSIIIEVGASSETANIMVDKYLPL